MTEILGGHATNPAQERKVGWPLHALGKEWPVSSMENRIKAQLEQLVRSRALKLIAVTSQTDPDGADGLREKFTEDYSNGLYNYPDPDGLEGKHIRRFMFSRKGTLEVMHLLLARCNKDVTYEQVVSMAKENPKEFVQAFKWALGNLLTPPATESEAGTTTEPATLDG